MRSARSVRTCHALGTLAVAVVLLAAVGCGSGTPVRYYTLVGSSVESSPKAADAQRVGVRLVVDPPYDQDRIAYRPPGADHEIAFYHYHRWAVHPAQALRDGLVEALDRLEGLSVASDRGEPSAHDVVLTVRVTRFEEVDDSEEDIRAVLSMTVERSDGESEALRIDLEETVADPSVTAVVDAFAAALDRAARRIAEELL